MQNLQMDLCGVRWERVVDEGGVADRRADPSDQQSGGITPWVCC